MKQNKILLPVLSAVMFLMGACMPAPSKPDIPETSKIIEEIRSNVSDRIAENVQLKIDELSSSINDTLISVNQSGDTATVVTVTNGRRLPVTVTIQELSIDVMSDYYKEYYDACRTQMRLNQVTIITIVVMSLILLVTIAVLLFFYRRLKSRNGVIASAIEHNYQLPESFYNPSSDRGWSVDIKYDNTAKNEKEAAEATEGTTENPNQTDQPSQPIPPVYRRMRNFEMGKRNVAIGIGVILIFSVWSAPAVAVLGVIPLLIGLGQLLSLKK